jgi:hypothetical protein
LESNLALSFFITISFRWARHTNNIQFQTIENNKTNEKLAIGGNRGHGSVFIYRYPIEATWKWIDEMKKGCTSISAHRRIKAGENRYCCYAF